MLLKVRCDKCNTKYKLDDSRIQGKGAKITCPRCGHVFVVMKPVPTPAPTAEAQGVDPAETATVSIPRAPSEILQARGDGSKSSRAEATSPTGAGAGLQAMTLSKRMPRSGGRPGVEKKPVSEMLKTTGPLAKLVKRPTSANDLDWKEVGITTFKVKVGIGLVYDFSDVATLKKYIAEKRVVETDRVSFDGKVWTVLKDINSIDEFFIDQWVALKLERMLEEEREAEEAGVESPLARMMAEPTEHPGEREPVLGAQTPLQAAAKKRPRRPVPPVEKPVTAGGRGARPEVPDLAGLKSTPTVPPPAPPGATVASGAKPDSNGLSASELFGDVATPEEQPPVDVPVDLPANRRPTPRTAASGVAGGKKSVRPASRRSSEVLTRVFDAVVVLLLAIVAGYLGWRYVTEARQFAQSESVETDPMAGMDQLEKLIAKHFPVAYAASRGDTPPTPIEASAVSPTPEPHQVEPTPQPDVKPAAKKGGTRATRKTVASNKTQSPKQRKGHVVVSNITAEDLYQVAVQAIEIKNYPMAIDSLEKAIEMKPRTAKYHYLLGYAYYRSGRQGKALKAFQQTLALKKPPNATHKWLGEIYASQGNKRAAIAEYEKYLKGSPADAETIRKKIAKLSNS